MATESAREKLVRLAPALSPRALDVLNTMYSSARLQGTEYEYDVQNTKISMEQGAEMHRIIRAEGVRSSLEVGFACGFSTVWLLDALPDDGAHIALDPFEKQNYGGVGLAQVAALNASASFEWKPEFSIHALSDAIREGRQFDFIFIDGNHRFDDVLIDFYLADQALRRGGLIAFDDLWMESVQTAIRFVESNRAYQRIEQPVSNMRVLRKLHADDRDWQHFVSFEAPAATTKSAIARFLNR